MVPVESFQPERSCATLNQIIKDTLPRDVYRRLTPNSTAPHFHY